LLTLFKDEKPLNDAKNHDNLTQRLARVNNRLISNRNKHDDIPLISSIFAG